MNRSTTPVLIYDGHCPFCRKQVANLKRLVGERFRLESFQDKGVLDHYPDLTYDDCMKEIKLVLDANRILGGAHAIFHTLSLAPLYRPLRWLYGLPLFKQLLDLAYAFVARNRYAIEKQHCNDQCHLQENNKNKTE
jgi:predicted DCC family thiol-disulfide oxidoreductase YuxK